MSEAERVTVRRAVAEDRVCSLLDEADLDTIVETMRYYAFPTKGEYVVRQGRAGKYFFVTHQGTLQVSMNGQAVNTIGPGSVFGGLALIYKCPRTANVTVTEGPAGVWGASFDTFRGVLEENSRRYQAERRSFLDSI